MVVIDEGHLIKNDKTQLNECVTRIKTKRRIVLTGTPFQNSLNEYYVMCNFVRPYLLGNKEEYRINFIDPITDGQHEDSQEHQVKFMKKRVYVLRKMLNYVMHRAPYQVLKDELLAKHEYVIKIRLAPVQEELYKKYIVFCKNNGNLIGKNGHEGFLNDVKRFVCLTNHPNILIDKNPPVWYNEILDREKVSIDENSEITNKEEAKETSLSTKTQMFLSILYYCEKNQEKLVVFSENISLLNFLEEVILANEQAKRQKFHVQYKDQFKTFTKNLDYLRSDGSTSATDRQQNINQFNDANNKQTRLFFLSKKACNTGINLIGANRCIIFDVSWNPGMLIK